MTHKGKKYRFTKLLPAALWTVAVMVVASPFAGRAVASGRAAEVYPALGLARDTLAREVEGYPVSRRLDSLSRRTGSLPLRPDTLSARFDSLPLRADTLSVRPDTLAAAPAVVRKERERPFLEAPVVGHAQDSLIYDVRNKLIFHYNKGDLTYEDNNLKADYIIVNASTKEIYGTGAPDSLGVLSRPEFIQGGANYTMDTLTYNLDSKKALVQGVATQDGEGFLLGRRMKKLADNSINVELARYTTCDRIEHPHFYIAMTKARVIPGKKIITGPAYFVMEDVPIYFMGLPGGFFPISTGPTAGLIMPTYGEESRRGFYLRGGGYYFTFGEHFDLKLTADLYTLGSWGVSASSNYVKRYKFSGNFSANYQQVILGERGGSDYSNSNSFSLSWTHSQDPKANPGQKLSANVNFSTSGHKQLATTSLADHLNTTTSSSITYARNWNLGATNISLNVGMTLGTRAKDTVVNLTLPNISFSVGKFSPFKRKERVGKEKWYEKISFSYSMNAQNLTGDVKEHEFFTKETLQKMKNGITHKPTVSMSFNLLNYINFTPSFNYQEAWNFQRQVRIWDPNMGQHGGMVPQEDLEREFGFFRSYDWNLGGSLSTKIYGMFEVKRKPGKTGWLQAIRHVITPSFGFTYAPDFNNPTFGLVRHVQNNANGSYETYNPNQGYGVISPAKARASINFSLANQLEIKVRSDRDSTGMRKITILEQFSFNSSYNFLARGEKEFPLAAFPVSIRTGELFPGFALQLSGTWDPYLWEDNGRGGATRVKKFNIGKGKFGRITNTSWSFGKTFNSPDAKSPDPTSIQGQYIDPYGPNPYDMANGLDPALRRQYMAQGWYDFSIPWSFTFNYNINYQYSSTLKPKITQSVTFNGNVTLTEKWGVNFNTGYDIQMRKISHMQVGLNRDLHCWSMSFNWVPMGPMKSYSFHIGIKSGMLADIKYDKSSNMYDNLTD